MKSGSREVVGYSSSEGPPPNCNLTFIVSEEINY